MGDLPTPRTASSLSLMRHMCCWAGPYPRPCGDGGLLQPLLQPPSTAPPPARSHEIVGIVTAVGPKVKPLGRPQRLDATRPSCSHPCHASHLVARARWCVAWRLAAPTPAHHPSSLTRRGTSPPASPQTKQVTKFKVGDRAGVGTYVDGCRKCSLCKSGEDQFCPEVRPRPPPFRRTPGRAAGRRRCACRARFQQLLIQARPPIPPAWLLPAACPHLLARAPRPAPAQAVFTYNAVHKDGLDSQVWRGRAARPGGALCRRPRSRGRRMRRPGTGEAPLGLLRGELGTAVADPPRPAPRDVPPLSPLPPRPWQGGYSTHIICDEHFTLKVPDNLDITGVAPLLCAGERRTGAQPGGAAAAQPAFTMQPPAPAPSRPGCGAAPNFPGARRARPARLAGSPSLMLMPPAPGLLPPGLPPSSPRPPPVLPPSSPRPPPVLPPSSPRPPPPAASGITTYSPYKIYGLDKPGMKIGVVGLGGLVSAGAVRARSREAAARRPRGGHGLEGARGLFGVD
jgi:hypothetical protein